MAHGMVLAWLIRPRAFSHQAEAAANAGASPRASLGRFWHALASAPAAPTSPVLDRRFRWWQSISQALYGRSSHEYTATFFYGLQLRAQACGLGCRRGVGMPPDVDQRTIMVIM